MQELVVLRRDDPAYHDEDISRSVCTECRDELRHESFVACCECRHSDDMDVIFDRLLRGFFRSLEQRADVDVEAQV